MSVNNVSKILWYIEPLAKQPFVVDGVQYTKQCDTIKLNESIVLKDNCECCGKCCINESNVFTEYEFKRMKENVNDDNINTYKRLVKLIKPQTHTINGNKVQVYVIDKAKKNVMHIPDRGEIDRCMWLNKIGNNYFCDIHDFTSITCKMPHLRFFYNKYHKTLSIGTHEYGRNWALKCPVEFKPVFEIQSKIEKMRWLNNVAKDLGIDTYIPEIIAFMQQINETNYKNLCGVDIKTYTHSGRNLF